MHLRDGKSLVYKKIKWGKDSPDSSSGESVLTFLIFLEVDLRFSIINTSNFEQL